MCGNDSPFTWNKKNKNWQILLVLLGNKRVKRCFHYKSQRKNDKNHNTCSEVHTNETKKHDTITNDKTSKKVQVVSRAHKKASRATKRDHKSNESALKSDQTIFNKVEELEKIASDLRKDVEIKRLKWSNSVHLLKNEVKYCQIFIFYPIPNQ